MNQKTQKNIVLIGFMGCGKSSVASLLGERCQMEVIEMDTWIARQQSLSIPDIFARYGEEYFRDLETALLKQLQNRTGYILSCGGGVPLRKENTALLKQMGPVILLTATPETIYSRTCKDQNRPNLNNRKNPEAIAELLEQRWPYYEAAAEQIIATDHKSISQICEEILKLLK